MSTNATAADEIPADFFVASDLADRTLLWGRGDTVWGDAIAADELPGILEDMLEESGEGERCDNCGHFARPEDLTFVKTAEWGDDVRGYDFDGYTYHTEGC
jgi:hypothetical protein